MIYTKKYDELMKLSKEELVKIYMSLDLRLKLLYAKYYRLRADIITIKKQLERIADSIKYNKQNKGGAVIHIR